MKSTHRWTYLRYYNMDFTETDKTTIKL